MSQKSSGDALSSLLNDLDVGSDVFSRPKTMHGMRHEQTKHNRTSSVQQNVGIGSQGDLREAQSPSSVPSSSTRYSSSLTSKQEQQNGYSQENLPGGESSNLEAAMDQYEHRLEGLEEMIGLSQWTGDGFSNEPSPSCTTGAVETEMGQGVVKQKSGAFVSKGENPPIDDPFAEFSTVPESSSQAMLLGVEDPGDSAYGSELQGQTHEAILFDQGLHDASSLGLDVETKQEIAVVSPLHHKEDEEFSTIRNSQNSNALVDVDLSGIDNHLSSGVKNQAVRSYLSEERKEPMPTPHKAFQMLETESIKSRESPSGMGSVLKKSSDNLSERYSSPRRVDSDFASNSREVFLDHENKPHRYNHGPAMGKGGEVVAEVSHRAAKALQAGTKWLMKASRQIAKDVHDRIERRKKNYSYDGSDNSFDPSWVNSNDAKPGVPPFYYDWAVQLVRMSPNTRATAMFAMSEEDRIIVQDLMDEAAIGEATIKSLDESPVTQIRNPFPVENVGHTVEPPTYDDVLKMQRDKPLYSKTEFDGKKSMNDMQYQSVDSQDQIQANNVPNLMSFENPYDPETAEAMLESSKLENSDSDKASPYDDVKITDNQQYTTKNDIDLLGLSHAEFGVESMQNDSCRNNDGDTDFSEMFSDLPASKNNKAHTSHVPDFLEGFEDHVESIDVDTHGYEDLYSKKEDGISESSEPELRRKAREKRLAERHERMKRQLAEKRALEEAEAAEKVGKVAFREELRPKIDAWTSGRRDNIRALLSSLHTVLWEGSGWKPPSIADMVENSQVKKWYMKANLIVHPDKVKQKGGTLEQVATADMVFDVLKAAWGRFEEQTRK